MDHAALAPASYLAPYEAGPYETSKIATAVRWPPGVVWTVVLLLTGAFFLADHRWDYTAAQLISTSESLTEAALEEGSSGRRMGLLLLAAGSLLALHFAPRASLLAQRGAPTWLAAAAAWAGLSLLWSTDPAVSFRRLVALGCIGVTVIALARTVRAAQFVQLVFGTTGLVLVIGLCAELFHGTFTPWQGDYRFAGTQHPNHQGLNCAILVVALWCMSRQFPRWRRLLLALAVAAFGMLLLTRSRSAAAALAASLMLFWALTWTREAKVFAGLLISAAALVLALAQGDDGFRAVGDMVLMGRADSDVGTLSGRAQVWRELRHFVQQRPFLGHGYGAFWTPEHVDMIAPAHWHVASAHSVYFELLLETGLVGAVLLLAACGTGLCSLWRDYRRQGESGTALIGLLVMLCLAHGLLESALWMPSLVPLLFFTGLCIAGRDDRWSPAPSRVNRQPAGSAALAKGGDR